MQGNIYIYYSKISLKSLGDSFSVKLFILEYPMININNLLINWCFKYL